MKEDFIILLHKYGYEHNGQPITGDELLEYLKSNGIDIDEHYMKSSVLHVISEAFTEAYSRNGQTLIFKSEAYYRYLEYLELVAANRNSKEARWLSVIAIGITIVLSVLPVL